MLRLVWLLVWAVALSAGVAEDAAIASRLKQKIARSSLKSDGLHYRVQDGVVEWSGSVLYSQRKGAATRIAKSSGAKRVVNRIVVQRKTTAATPKPLPRAATVQIPKP